MKKLVIDTNGFLRYLLNDVPSQANKIEAFFQRAKEGRLNLLVPQIIIFEIAFALDKVYKFPKFEVVEKLKSILSSNFLEIQDGELLNTSLEIYFKESISFADAFILTKTKDQHAEFFTFDQKLQKLSLQQ